MNTLQEILLGTGLILSNGFLHTVSDNQVLEPDVLQPVDRGAPAVYYHPSVTNFFSGEITPAVSNVLVCVTTRTNATYGDNSGTVEGIYYNVPTNFMPPIRLAPTERWTITNIYQILTLSFDWFGRREIEHTKLVSSVTNRQVLKATWEDVK